ncbi:MAG: YciI family protein [Pirellulales bacterium]
MQYMLLIHSSENGWSELAPAEQDQWMAAYRDFHEKLIEGDVLRGVNRLQPSSTATVVRVTNGKPLVTDGPFAETKEQLGGYFLIEAPDLDAAIAWAGKCPGARHGAIEIRPVLGEL